MIFADKLILLRKKAGWSQEELAEQMDVTRQSVLKWEGAQSIPDLEKMVRLSELFGVSTDYLLKDEIEDVEGQICANDTPKIKRVSMEEVNAFLAVKEKTAKHSTKEHTPKTISLGQAMKNSCKRAIIPKRTKKKVRWQVLYILLIG